MLHNASGGLQLKGTSSYAETVKQDISNQSQQ
jgi:hypothetical protein